MWIKQSDKDKVWFECPHCKFSSEIFFTDSIDAEDYAKVYHFCPNCGHRMNRNIEEFIVPSGLYRHFKGKYYIVLGTAIHTETDEVLVVYQGLYDDHRSYCRPVTMFLEEVERPELGYKGPRFQRISTFD